jgi:hypothetical protein
MNRTLALVLAAAIAATPAGGALAQTASADQRPSGQQTFDMRDDASAWIHDPDVYRFYQLTIDAFANGPEHLDRAAYLRGFHEIFQDFAVQHHIPPEHLQDHLKAIPGEMILIVTRDPKTLDSYDNFVVALFGPQPQKSAPGAG